VKRLVLWVALACALPSAADARPRVKSARRSADQGAQHDPARWFATRAGLIRVYQEKSARRSADGEPPQAAGASCEVVESKPSEGEAAGQTRELCTLIVGKKPKPTTRLTYELRPTGIFMVKAESDGKAQSAERMLLPEPLRIGAAWKNAAFKQHIKSAGAPCSAAGHKFGDCLVVTVVQKKGGRVAKRFSEIYAAGVGLVEDAQWQLVDVKGL